jgi:hypothetical protein
MTELAAIHDPAAILAALRKGDEAVIAAAYRRVFDNPDGQLVLIHHMGVCQLAAFQGPGMSGEDRAYFAGKADGALSLLQLAGFDPRAAQVAVATDSMRGLDDDRFRNRDPGPDGGSKLPGADEF